MLQGKAKEEFFKKYMFDDMSFALLTPIYQNALIIEWFDSVGIIITINYWIEASYTISNRNGDKDIYSGICGKTRTEATTRAIEKAVEIFNKLNNGK